MKNLYFFLQYQIHSKDQALNFFLAMDSQNLSVYIHLKRLLINKFEEDLP